VRILRVFERNTSNVRIFFVFTTNQFLQVLSCQNQNSTPPLPNVELKFQMQAMTKMMERMNLVMGNVCDKLEKVGKHGNMARTCNQDVRKVGDEPKSNNGSGAENQGGLIIWILRRTLLILVMVVLRMRP